MAYDGYKEFYTICGRGMQLNMPADYKETVLCVLRRTGLDMRGVEAVCRYLKIGQFEDMKAEEPDTLIQTGFAMNMSGAEVLRKIQKLTNKCLSTPRRELLEKGLVQYLTDVDSDVKELRKKYKALDAEYNEMLRQAHAKRRERDEVLAAFADGQGIEHGSMRRLVEKDPWDYQMSRAGLASLIDGRNWDEKH